MVIEAKGSKKAKGNKRGRGGKRKKMVKGKGWQCRQRVIRKLNGRKRSKGQ